MSQEMTDSLKQRNTNISGVEKPTAGRITPDAICGR